MSSSVIVPVPCVSPSVTLVPLFRLTVKLSVDSGTVSSVVAIEIVPPGCPGLIVRVWLSSAVKSPGEPAEPTTVE